MTLAAGTLLIFGATGDLAQRMLLPSLYALHTDRLIPPELTILGTARSHMNNEGFRLLAEAALAWQLEQRWKKDQILTAYLNTVYFGRDAYGIRAASERYFNEQPIDLTVPQAAMLAGMISALVDKLSVGTVCFEPTPRPGTTMPSSA